MFHSPIWESSNSSPRNITSDSKGRSLHISPDYFFLAVLWHTRLSEVLRMCCSFLSPLPLSWRVPLLNPAGKLLPALNIQHKSHFPVPSLTVLGRSGYSLIWALSVCLHPFTPSMYHTVFLTVSSTKVEAMYPSHLASDLAQSRYSIQVCWIPDKSHL